MTAVRDHLSPRIENERLAFLYMVPSSGKICHQGGRNFSYNNGDNKGINHAA